MSFVILIVKNVEKKLFARQQQNFQGTLKRFPFDLGHDNYEPSTVAVCVVVDVRSTVHPHYDGV